MNPKGSGTRAQAQQMGRSRYDLLKEQAEQGTAPPNDRKNRVTIPRDVFDWAKEKADENEWTVSELTAEALRHFLPML